MLLIASIPLTLVCVCVCVCSVVSDSVICVYMCVFSQCKNTASGFDYFCILYRKKPTVIVKIVDFEVREI